MKKYIRFTLLSLIMISSSSCGMFESLFGGDTDTVHKTSYEAITGKYYLYDSLDKRHNYTDTYFDINGKKGDFTLKYYENGVLKKDGVFQRIVTYKDKIGTWKDNLHFNIKCGDTSEHIGTYTESFDPIDQFRIVEEYTGADTKYYLSELPFVIGTYVREGKEYKEESAPTGDTNYIIPTLETFTSGLNGIYRLDENHYFYFLFPNINDNYAFGYYQYFSSSLDKPLEGFVQGKTHTTPYTRQEIYFTTSREVLFYKTYQDTANNIIFGYYSFDANDRMVDNFGSVDFSNGVVNSFTFEHLSREWTDAEWDEYTKNIEYHMPDPIIYDYVGGTYIKEN